MSFTQPGESCAPKASVKGCSDGKLRARPMLTNRAAAMHGGGSLGDCLEPDVERGDAVLERKGCTLLDVMCRSTRI